MNLIKKLAVAALVGAMTLTATSCQLSTLLAKETEPTDSTAETSAPAHGFTLPGSTTAAEPMDLTDTDLSQYVTVANYRGLTVTETVTPLTDEAFETEMNNYINGITVYEEITDRPTAKGDTIVMDYVGTLNGIAFEGGTAQGQTIELSENSGYIEGFAEGLIGVTPGSTVALNLTFPADYGATELAGKATVFTVTVHYIMGDRITPELTDEFISKYTKGEFTTAQAFRDYYRDYLETSAVEKAHTDAIAELWSKVFENSTFHKVPDQQVQYYHSQLKGQYESYAAAYGVSYDTVLSAFGLTADSLLEQAQQYAKQDLVFYSLVQAEGLTVTDAEYNEGLALIASANNLSAAEIEAYYGKDYIVDSLLWDKMLEMIYSYATITK